MLRTALLAGAEQGINRLLRLDPTALSRLARLSGTLIEVRCTQPDLTLFVMADDQGLRLAAQWDGTPDCTLHAPASSLARLAVSPHKTAVLHEPHVRLEGDSAALMSLAEVLQSLELDWEHELSRWLGPVGTQLLGDAVRKQGRWLRQSGHSLQQNLAEYLAEEARALVGTQEAEARFSELDELKLRLDRLDARIARLTPVSEPHDPA